jgi:Na+/H+ antiporter NhaC
VNLGRNGYVSPKNIHVIEQLLHDGLVTRTPALRLMNQSFQAFVHMVRRPADTAISSEESRSSVWGMLRAPIIIVIMGVVLFLFITQRDVLNSTMAFLTVTAGLIPVIIKLFSMLQPDAPQAPGQR